MTEKTSRSQLLRVDRFRARRSQNGTIIRLVVLTLAFGLFVLWLASPPDPDDANTGLVFGGIIGVVLSIAVHELGHAVAALLVGWKLRLVTIGPLLFNMNPLSIRPARIAWIAGIEGLTVAIPPDGTSARKGELIYSLGGPAGNFGFAAAIALVAPYVPSKIAVLVSTIASVSALLGIGNLIPFSSRNGFNSDGKRIIRRLVSKPDTAAHSSNVIGRLVLGGVRPCDWDHELVAALRDDNSTDVAGRHLLLHMWHFERGELGEARSALDKAREANPKSSALAIQDAFFSAWAESDPEHGQAILDGLELYGLYEPYDYWMARAAICLGLGNADDARAAISLAKKEAAHPVIVASDRDLELISAVEAKILTQASPIIS